MSNPFQDAYTSSATAPASSTPQVDTGDGSNPFQSAFTAQAGSSTGSSNPFQDAYNTGATAPAPAPSKSASKPDLLQQFLGGAGKVENAVGSIAGEAGKEVARNVVGAGENVVNDVSLGGTHFGNPGEQFSSQILPTQQQWTNTLNQNPILGGIPRGIQQTGEEIAHPSRIAKNYSNNPLMAALNDIGTVASVLPGVGEIIHGLAAGADTTEAVSAAARAGQASQLTAAAAKAGDVIKQVGEFPTISHLLSSGREGLSALADRLASDPELLHAVDESVAPSLEGGTGDAAQAATAAAEPPSASVSKITDMATALQKAIDSGDIPSDQVDRAKSLISNAQELATSTAQSSSQSIIDQAGSAAQAEQSQARNLAQQAVDSHKKGILNSLGRAGAGLQQPTQQAVSTVVDMMNRLKSVDGTVADATKAGETAVIPLRDGTRAVVDTTADDAGKATAAAKQTIVNKAMAELLNNPAVTRITDMDEADLTAAAKAQHMALADYIKSLGFTSVQDATNGRITGELAKTSFLPSAVADQVSKFSARIEQPGVVGTALEGVNKLTMVAKLGLSPTTVLNRLGHGVLAAAANPNMAQSLKRGTQALLGHLTPEQESDLEKTTMVTRGAVQEASMLSEADNPSRIKAITNALTSIPTAILQKSPFLRIARSMDTASRKGIWLAARDAGASAQEADTILGRTAGYFDRSTPGMRTVSKVIPFANWHKQVMAIFEHMAEDHPAGFAQFTNAAAHMAQYNTQQGLTGAQSSDTIIDNRDVNLSFLNPFSSTATSLTPQELLSPPLKALYPIVTGVGVSGFPTSTPTGPIEGNGTQQFGAAKQELINTVPQLAALQGSQPRYGNGQINPKKSGGGWEQTWSTLLGVPEIPTSVTGQNAVAAAKSAAVAEKIQAGEAASYKRKLAASGK